MSTSRVTGYVTYSGGAHGGGGGNCPPPYGFFFFLLVSSVVGHGHDNLIPLPHYDFFLETFLKSEKKSWNHFWSRKKNVSESPPPPPPPPSDFLRAGANFLGSRRSSETFPPPPPPPSKHPGAAPGYITFTHKKLGERITFNWNEMCCITSEEKNRSSQKLGKSGFCTLHLQRSLTRWSVTMMMQARCQIKADALLLILVHNLQE